MNYEEMLNNRMIFTHKQLNCYSQVIRLGAHRGLFNCMPVSVKKKFSVSKSHTGVRHYYLFTIQIL